MALLPTTAQVGRLMWWRTKAVINGSVPAGELVGDFTDDTQPTGPQAAEIIAQAASSLVDVTGALAAAEASYPDEVDQAVTAAIAYQAAADIEASMSNTSPDKLAWLQARADALKTGLRLAIQEFIDTGATGVESASGSYVEDPLFLGLPLWPGPLYGSLWGYPPEEAVLANKMLPTGVLPVSSYPWGSW